MDIVIVDDQTSARTMLRHIVEDIGPELDVHDFGDPDAALAWCDEQPPGPAAAGLPHARHGRTGIRAAFPPPADATATCRSCWSPWSATSRSARLRWMPA